MIWGTLDPSGSSPGEFQIFLTQTCKTPGSSIIHPDPNLENSRTSRSQPRELLESPDPHLEDTGNPLDPHPKNLWKLLEDSGSSQSRIPKFLGNSQKKFPGKDLMFSPRSESPPCAIPLSRRLLPHPRTPGGSAFPTKTPGSEFWEGLLELPEEPPRLWFRNWEFLGLNSQNSQLEFQSQLWEEPRQSRVTRKAWEHQREQKSILEGQNLIKRDPIPSWKHQITSRRAKFHPGSSKFHPEKPNPILEIQSHSGDTKSHPGGSNSILGTPNPILDTNSIPRTPKSHQEGPNPILETPNPIQEDQIPSWKHQIPTWESNSILEIKFHPGDTKFHPGSSKSHPGDTKSHPEETKSHPGGPDSILEAPNPILVSPGVLRQLEQILIPWIPESSKLREFPKNPKIPQIPESLELREFPKDSPQNSRDSGKLQTQGIPKGSKDPGKF
ncbi:hypothetical protein HGM15179_018010 [Zosterops borbonicus]|uniref:Uncharacterized protein n=1 Tax=Zosterops borbonicus TaxID=364589 RepID=A0A8K1FZT5_9PASS|nr:hypothetical protein HGM15179_018010 [Zosterops borbonicus]